MERKLGYLRLSYEDRQNVRERRQEKRNLKEIWSENEENKKKRKKFDEK